MKLCDDSKKIIQFVKKTGLSVKKKNINMKELFEDIKEAFEYVTYTDLYVNKSMEKILNISQASSATSIDSIGQGSIHRNVRKKIMDSLLFTVKYTFKMFGRLFNIMFNICDIVDIDKTDIMLESIIMWLYVVNLYSPPKCSKKIDIYIFLCDNKKRMPKETIDIIGQDHVNSAYTYCCQSSNQIVVYRKEEWFKVFIHETMHSFGLDFCGNNNDKIIKSHMKPIFNVKSDMNIYEAYCETWAVIINAAFGSFGDCERNISKIKDLTYAKFGKKFREIMSDEVVFSTFQMEKILSHMGLNYNDLYSNDSASVIKRYLYNEESEVFSYFVVKTILLYNYNLFILWCKNNNYSLLNFKTNERNVIEFCKFVISLHKKSSFLEHISNIRKIEIGNKDKKLILDTARMTSHAHEF